MYDSHRYTEDLFFQTLSLHGCQGKMIIARWQGLNAVVRLSDVKNLVYLCVKKVDFSLRFGLTFLNGHVLTMETFWHCLVYNILHNNLQIFLNSSNSIFRELECSCFKMIKHHFSREVA